MSFAEQKVIDKLPEFPSRGSLIALIMQRRAMGMEKYNGSVDDAVNDSLEPLTEGEWLRHALEEKLDAAIYLEKAIQTSAHNPASQMRWHLMQRTTLQDVLDLYQAIQWL